MLAKDDVSNKYLISSTNEKRVTLRRTSSDYEAQSAFQLGLGSYSIKDGIIGENYRSGRKRGWERGLLGGLGGMPLSYNKESGEVYFDNTDTHSMIIGSTGSKKSRLFAIPTVKILAAAGESMIISDPKAEIYAYTAEELRRKGYNVAALNLRNLKLGCRWNPLAIPYKFYCLNDTSRACEFANDVAINLATMNADSDDPFWSNSAGSFFFGLTVLLFKYCKEHNLDVKEVNLRNVLELRNIMCKGNNTSNSKLWKYAQLDSFIKSLLIGTIETANDTRRGILSVFDQNMRVFSILPDLLDALTENEFDFDSIIEKPTAFYLIMPDEKTAFHGLVSLFVKQSYEYIIYSSQNRNIPSRRINYILDEFSALPTINDFPAMITAARSRNIRFYLFIQSQHQLQQRYPKEAETIKANCTNWVFLTSRELNLLEEISSLCGVKEHSTTQKPILSIADLQRFNKEEGEVLILSGRKKPYKAYLPDISFYSTSVNSEKKEEERQYIHREPLDFHLEPNEYMSSAELSAYQQFNESEGRIN